jgi:hypothetical protein
MRPSRKIARLEAAQPNRAAQPLLAMQHARHASAPVVPIYPFEVVLVRHSSTSVAHVQLQIQTSGGQCHNGAADDSMPCMPSTRQLTQSSPLRTAVGSTAERALLLEAKASWKDPKGMADWSTNTCPCGGVSSFNYSSKPSTAWRGVWGCERGRVTYV